MPLRLARASAEDASTPVGGSIDQGFHRSLGETMRAPQRNALKLHRLQKVSTDALLIELDKRAGQTTTLRLQLPSLTPRTVRRTRGRQRYDRYAKALPGIICQGWAYCRKRKKYSRSAELMAALAAVVAERLHVSQPTALIIILIFGRYLLGTLDDLCECK